MNPKQDPRPHRVSIVPCRDYTSVETAVRLAFELSGSMRILSGPASRVLIKPNLIHAAEPDKATTTHPQVVKAVVRVLQENGHMVTIADSYSGAIRWTSNGLRKVYRRTGMQAVAEETNCLLNYDVDWNVRPLPKGLALRRVELLELLSDIDWIVNVPKLKTHVYTGLTCAVKNLFGLVPGHFKVGYHARFNDKQKFSQAVKDIAVSLPVRATLVDAIVAMEGDGPTGGKPRDMGVIMAGTDMLAVDRIAARFCGLSPRSLAWLGAGDVDLVGRTPEDILPGGLKKPTAASPEMGVFSNPLVRRLTERVLRDVFSPVPRMDQTACVQCYACLDGCPAKAIKSQSRSSTPRIDGKQCIRCYCCHEACLYNAIRIPESRFARWLA